MVNLYVIFFKKWYIKLRLLNFHAVQYHVVILRHHFKKTTFHEVYLLNDLQEFTQKSEPEKTPQFMSTFLH